MGEIAVTILKIIARYVFILAGVTAFIVLLNLAVSVAFVAWNVGAYADIYAIVCMWLPFNLPVVMTMLLTAAVAYMAYRMALTAMIWLNRILA